MNNKYNNVVRHALLCKNTKKDKYNINNYELFNMVTE